MNIRAMHVFEGLHKFLLFTEKLENTKWKIEKQLLKERVEKYRNANIFKDLKEQFKTKEISIWELKEEEVITWIDTLTLLRRAFIQILKKGYRSDEVCILMEYPLINGNYMRTDYLIIHNRLIFVLEFGMFNQDEKRSEERYTKKLQESINYRQIIANQVTNDISVINYVMIYKPEFDRYENKTMNDNIIYNDVEINKLSNYIFNLLMKQQNLSAINQLKIIEMTNN